MIKYIGIGIAGLALVGCTQAAPAPVVTVTAPAPTVTVQPPAQTNEYQDAMEYAWSTLTQSDKDSVCLIFNYDPQEAWDAFNSEAGNSVPQSEFNAFLTSKCSSF